MSELIESLRRLSAIKGRPFTVAERAEAAIAMSEAAAALEAAREDAERYRWLRDCDAEGESLVMTADGRELKTCEYLDAAIDQARGKRG